MSNPDRPKLPWGPLQVLLRRLRRPRRPDRPIGPAHPDQRAVDADRLRVQVRVIRKAFRDEIGAGPAEGPRQPRDDAEATYLFRPGHALVRARDVEQVVAFFDERSDSFEGGAERVGEPTPGLVLLSLPQRTDRQDDVLATLDEIDRALGPATATPDHVVYVTRARMCPASEPEEIRTEDPWPPTAARAKRPGEDRVRVAVVDTGLWTDAVGSAKTPWLQPGAVVADPADVEVVDPNAIHAYAGHGTFVTGVISCLAPYTRIEVEGVLTRGGAVYESEIVEQLHQAINDNDHPQIISISAGTHTRGDFASLAFEMLGSANELAERDDVLIVAAAGNDASRQPFWPAAFDWVVSVGSVDPDKKVSDFSNHGKGWVDVYARGRDVVNAFPKGVYTCHEPPHVGEVRQFDGLARWSGTSFSTPIVSGLIAAEMRDNGLSARAAWDVVRQSATTVHDARIGEDVQIVGPLT